MGVKGDVGSPEGRLGVVAESGFVGSPGGDVGAVTELSGREGIPGGALEIEAPVEDVFADTPALGGEVGKPPEGIPSAWELPEPFVIVSSVRSLPLHPVVALGVVRAVGTGAPRRGEM